MIKQKRLGRLVLALGCFTLFAQGVGMAGYQFVTLNIADEFGLNNTMLGVISSMQYVAFICMPLFFGGLGDRLDKRLIVCFCTVGVVLGCGLLCISNGLFLIAASIFIVSAGFSLTEGMVTAAMADAAPETTGRSTNLSQVFYCLGAVLAPLLLNLLIAQGMDWRGHFIVTAVLAAVVAVLFYVIRLPRSKPLSQEEQRSRGRLWSVGLALFLITVLIYVAVESGYLYFSRPYFERELGDMIGAGLSISAVWAGMIPSRFLASFVHKRKNALLIVCFLLSAACCTLMSLVKIPVYSVLWCLLFGVFAGPIFPTLLSVSMDAFPGRTARVATIVFGASGIGGMASNVAMGALSDAVGVGDAFFLMSALALLGAIIYVFTARSMARGRNRQVGAEK